MPFTGANGAGKSTLLKCINGLLKPPSTGSIKWLGKGHRTSFSSGKRQRFWLCSPEYTGPELSPYGYGNSHFRTPSFWGKQGKEDVEKRRPGAGTVWIVGLCFSPDGSVKRRRAAERIPDRQGTGRWSHRASLLDEPTSSLDLRYQYEVMELLVKVSREKNLAVVAVIHDLNLALDFADR